MDSISRPDDVAPISYTELAPSGAPARWIVLVHGGGVSKECYLETPDGRLTDEARLARDRVRAWLKSKGLAAPSA